MVYAVIIIALAAWLIFYGNTRRAKRFVRAHAYTMLYQAKINEGKSTKEASQEANDYVINFVYTKYSNHDHDMEITKGAHFFLKEFYDGKQLPIIAHARRLGFLG